MDDETWTPSPGLVQFLSDCLKPIAITLGGLPESVPEGEEEHLDRVVIEACKGAGARAVVQPGALNLGRGELPPGFLRCREADYKWLFPRVAAVVHHCGAGTTAFTLRAGDPSVAVPHAWDQPYWAGVLFDRGVSPQPLRRTEVTVENLAERIVAVISNDDFRVNATALSDAIAHEDGTAAAIALIERSAEQQMSDQGRGR